MKKRLSSQAVVALQEALSVIYHFKKDLRRFLETCGVDRAIIGHLDWNQYKRQIIADLFDILLRDQDRFSSVLSRLCHEVAAMKSFAHLARLEDAKPKIAAAEAAVGELRELVESHQSVEEEERRTQERLARASAREEKRGAFQTRLREIRTQFLRVSSNEQDPQQRGRDLEDVMAQVFDLFDLDPRASFRIDGEQIDGAFTLDGSDYLFEAKWEKGPVERSSLDEFVAKVGRKLDNTLGLFLSISGFKESAVEKHSDRRSTILLMEQYDLLAVLDERIDFVEMLRRKRRHAAETGNIFFQVYPTLL